MTVPSTVNRNDYVGTASQATYAYTFRILDQADLAVSTTSTTGVNTPLVLTTDYTVTGVLSYTGGTITLLAGNLATNVKLAILRQPAEVQDTSLQNQGAYYATTVEQALDLLTMQVQSLQNEVDGCFKIPPEEIGTVIAVTAPAAAQRANSMAAWDASGNLTTGSSTTVTNGANTFTGAQTVNLSGATLPATISTALVLKLMGPVSFSGAGGNGIEAFGFQSTALAINCRLAGGGISAPLYPTNGLVAWNVFATAYDQVAVGYAAASLARHLILTTEAHSNTAKGFGHRFSCTRNTTAAPVETLWIQGGASDATGTIGIGAAPTTGNGLVQRATGTTRANGDAYGTDTFLWRDSANSLTTEGRFRSIGPTSGIGYGTGAGSATTQLTSRSTGVTTNTVSGSITLFTTPGSTTPTSFTVTTAAVAATDVVVLSQKSGTDKYILLVTAVAGGSFQITAYTTGGTTNEAPVINYAIIKAVAS